jgi:hypothetical protein
LNSCLGKWLIAMNGIDRPDPCNNAALEDGFEQSVCCRIPREMRFGLIAIIIITASCCH